MSPLMRKALYAAAAFAVAFGVLKLTDRSFFRHRVADDKSAPFTPEERPRVEMGQLPVSMALSAEYALIVGRVMPGVVSIHVQRRRMVTESVLRPGGPGEEESVIVTEPGVGSGAIVSKEGHIITNWHVVEGGEDSIFVTLSGEEGARRAALIDKDDQIDIALLKVELRRPGEVFPALRFGDSDKMSSGNHVLAMGSPFNLRETVTSGIISHRERRVSDTLTAYLQVDCPINPGNSGGPLVNLQGDITGIVTRKLQGHEAYASGEGYGLAIPGNDVADALERLRSEGRPRIYLGLTVDDWPRDNWQKGKPSEAVIVTGVSKQSPAEKAGFQLSDVIESVNGTRVTSFSEYRRAMRGHKVGDTLTFTVRRGRDVKQLSVVLADFDKAVPPESAVKPDTVRGVTVRVLRRSERNLLGLTEAIGLAVEAVEENSPFASILRPGMNVLLVSNQDGSLARTVATPDQFRAELNSVAATGGCIITGATGEPNRPLPFPPLP